MKEKSHNKKRTAVDIFKDMLLLLEGKSVGNIHPYRLKSAPSVCAGFEKMTVAEAGKSGVTVPDGMKPKDMVYVFRMGPVVFKECISEDIFLAAFEPVPLMLGNTQKTIRQELPDTRNSALDEILHKLSCEIESVDKYQTDSRTKLMCMLKEYLGEKYGHKVCFISPADNIIGEILYERSFHPAPVTVYDRYGTSPCNAPVSVELTPKGKIKILTDEAGVIYDAEEYLSNDDLFALCNTVIRYEQVVSDICKELAENGDWEDVAREMLAEHFPEVENKIREDFVHDYWENLQSSDYNLKKFRLQYMENNK